MDDRFVGDDVVERHREVLRRGFVIVQNLTSAMEDVLAHPGRVSERDTVLGIGDRTSVCDAAVKLFGILGKLIALERESYGLDDRIDPKDLDDDQIVRLLQRGACRGSGSPRA